jgi:AraC family transcriptional regulator of adaptative response/methylated-DNA-[protein]-cysteine methyltransferase
MPPKSNSFATDDQRWNAIVDKDRAADTKFFYSVKSTGVYCRPTCAARLPNRENVQFHLTSRDAERAGFRPCKRCKPNDLSAANHHAAAITKACKLIVNSPETPDTSALAAAVNMSSSHFHRTFKSLTGLTPKSYAAAQRAERLRKQLARNRTVTSAIYNAGFNSNAPFYTNSNKLLGMKPTAFRRGGRGATIQFSIAKCSLGSILVAATGVGICAITLGDDPATLIDDLHHRFPNANFTDADETFKKQITEVTAFVERPAIGLDLPLDIQGTAFQQRVWQELRKIPCGQTSTYSKIAQKIGSPKSIRAIGQACGANPIAVAIPCHRVVGTDGSLSGYRWGLPRKSQLLKSEVPSS